MIADERHGQSDLPVIIAQHTGACIIPVATRNKAEIIITRSWDDHLIPLATGIVSIGQPVIFMRERMNKEEIQQESQRINGALRVLDSAIGYLTRYKIRL